ncbi:MAG: hypothetical protein M0R33_11490 [Methylomonas sp.]|jgi:hypothetical protein|uniref:hypothetical protein n=1 Tax=Methylomonas sp. TaxID=418 RepID=UPI0025EF769A|nr:hypothetical protein [Methylomonas sp.]MCK9607057.1 hypothetical protein [Methylomonas sp.]
MTNPAPSARNQVLAFLLAWFLIVLAGFWAPSMCIDSAGPVSLKADLMLRTIIVIGLGYLLYPGWQLQPSRIQALFWSFMLALAYLTIAIYVDDNSVFTATALNATIAIFLLSLFLHGVVISLSALSTRKGMLPLCGIWIFVLLFTLPLWVAPWVETAIVTPARLNIMLWSSPLSYLAAMLDYDYLRQQWFYQHLPYGALRYDYPDARYYSIGLLIVSLITLVNPKLGKGL